MRLSILACMAAPANGQAIERRVQILEERFSNGECEIDRGAPLMSGEYGVVSDEWRVWNAVRQTRHSVLITRHSSSSSF